MPKTKIGKISFWMVIVAFIGIYLNYWLSMLSDGTWRIVMPGFLMVGAVCICGIISIIAIVKYRDRAILLFLSSLLGILGIMFVLGEFLVPH
jgi:hypothetical protein